MLGLLLAALRLLAVTHVDSSPLPDDHRAPQEEWSAHEVHSMQADPETLEELTTTTALVEGDMVLPSDRNAVTNIWPTTRVPYAISSQLAGRTADLLAAMAMVSEHTCLSFHKRTAEPDYLHFVIGNGCASYVGRMGGGQSVFVGPKCTVGNVAHEVLHALGFYHEHTRMDREEHVTVLTDNIMEGKEINFQKHWGNTLGLSYDVLSILHYGSDFFSANGLPTIVPLNSVADMGQREKMTPLDVRRVVLLYACGTPSTRSTCTALCGVPVHRALTVLFSSAELTKNQDEEEDEDQAGDSYGPIQNSTNQTSSDREEGHSSSSSLSVRLDAATGGQNHTGSEKNP
uniref:Metalloendopeptidase n=1 Tax=Gasterosteus aculeatus aculeatus TaxID=481459 RepID=A0AAQ4RK95_GASAC